MTHSQLQVKWEYYVAIENVINIAKRVAGY